MVLRVNKKQLISDLLQSSLIFVAFWPTYDVEKSCGRRRANQIITFTLLTVLNSIAFFSDKIITELLLALDLI